MRIFRIPSGFCIVVELHRTSRNAREEYLVLVLYCKKLKEVIDVYYSTPNALLLQYHTLVLGTRIIVKIVYNIFYDDDDQRESFHSIGGRHSK